MFENIKLRWFLLLSLLTALFLIAIPPVVSWAGALDEVIATFGAGFLVLAIIGIILAFFLPFFVFGIYNQTKKTAGYLSEITKLMRSMVNTDKDYEERLKEAQKNPNSIFYEKK